MINIKKYAIAIYSAVCCICVLASCVLLFSKEKAPDTYAVSSPYYLREYQGKVALYNKTNGTQVGVYDIYTHLLPTQDYEMLKTGIDVSTPEELSRLLEDFGL